MVIVTVACSAAAVFFDPGDAVGRPRRSVGGTAVSLLEPGLGLRLAGGVGGEAGDGCAGPHGVGGRHVVIVQWVDVSVAE